MEALTAVSVAALTIYDMCKSADRAMVISGIKLTRKSGGRSGTFGQGSRGRYGKIGRYSAEGIDFGVSRFGRRLQDKRSLAVALIVDTALLVALLGSPFSKETPPSRRLSCRSFWFLSSW